MGAQICESCEHKYDRNMRCYCSPNSTCDKYKQIKMVTEKSVDDNFVHEYDLINQAIESAKCRIYRLKQNEGDTLAHQKKAKNQQELMKVTIKALEYYRENAD